MSPSQARTARQVRPPDDAATAAAADEPTRTKATRRRTRARAEPDPPELVLDRYRLKRRLGSGAFGTVWLARDERLERDVAVKALPRERVMGGRFEREARAAARLSHPGIVTLYEASVDDEGAYLVSELVRGRTLDQVLEAGRLSDRDIVRIGVALCDALSHAHEQGVVHRDVKPSNVLVADRPATPDQLAKLTDFGVARVLGGDTLTKTGDIIGTLAYMAPEQAEGREAGPEADLYSLALVLYEALTGVNPVRPMSGTVRTRRLGTYLPPLRRQRRELPRELGQAVDMALRPRPRERGRLLDLRRALFASWDQVSPEPGVVAAPWTSQLGSDEQDDDLDQPFSRPSAVPPEDRPRAVGKGAIEPGERTSLVWPRRGIAAVGAAATAAWLVVHGLAGAGSGIVAGTAPPALAALVAGGLVLLLPRLGWLALTVAAAVTISGGAHVGFALIVLIALILPGFLMPLSPTAWPATAAAVALGLIGLGGAWPALAGRAGGIWRRAGLGAAGYVWLLLAAPLAGRSLYVSGIAGLQSPGGWSDSLPATVHQVLLPLLRSGALAPAAVWALAALALPWLVRGRSLPADAVMAVVWSATTAAATTAVLAAAHLPGSAAFAVHGALPGAVVAALAALAIIWLPRVGSLRAPAQASGVRAQFP